MMNSQSHTMSYKTPDCNCLQILKLHFIPDIALLVAWPHFDLGLYQNLQYHLLTI